MVLTSSSSTCGNDLYHWLTAKKGSGVARQMHLPTSASTVVHASREATGTAITISFGCRFRAASTAASIVEPVAAPSSTRMTVRPDNVCAGYPSRNNVSRFSISLSAVVVTAELPGIKTEDVKVEVTDETLTIRGERKQERKEEKWVSIGPDQGGNEQRHSRDQGPPGFEERHLAFAVLFFWVKRRSTDEPVGGSTQVNGIRAIGSCYRINRDVDRRWKTLRATR